MVAESADFRHTIGTMQTTTLFGDMTDPAPAPAEPPIPGPFAAIAIEQSVDRTLDYGIPARLVSALRVGQRVRVPLGRNDHATHGYVISIHPTTTYPRIKRLLNIDDERVLIAPKLMELSRWMSRYYCAPLGTVLETVLPSAVRNQTAEHSRPAVAT
jgi:primosomal protein N'